ncbi:MAG TPA: DUF2269 family protein [Gemmatimonadales bacterium]|jgi:uncharacterized membrane protein|nr:DUF2269 family protein [Gemmatimonadales bacterium]
MDEAPLVRMLHVAGAVLLLGNVTVTGFWAMFMYRQRSLVPFRPVARAILWTDLAFTAVGGIMLTVSGILLVRIRGYVIGDTPWLVHGIGALASSTVLWLAVLLPDQWRLERMDPADGIALRRVFRRWTIVGWTTTAILFYGLWAMVTGRVA